MSTPNLSELLTSEEPVFNAYKRTVTNMIYADLLEAAKPMIRKAAEEAVKHLEGSLRSYVEDAKNKTVIEINLRINEESMG